MIVFEKPGTLPRPGPLGRGLRLALGIFLLYNFVIVLLHFEGLVRSLEGWDVPGGNWWLGVALAFYFLSHLVSSTLGRDWGWWPQLVVGLLALAAVGLDWVIYGSLWAPPLGFLVFLFLAYFLGHVGIAFLVAGLFATPG